MNNSRQGLFISEGKTLSGAGVEDLSCCEQQFLDELGQIVAENEHVRADKGTLLTRAQY